MDFAALTGKIAGIIWSNALVYLCLGAGVYFSLIMRFPQLRLFKDMIKQLFNRKTSANGVSSFQSFAMALGGRVGIGNIAGVATAIYFGGPGAIFWMWVIAFLGAGAAYIESSLAQVWKQEIAGEYRGGPAYYIEKGLKNKPFAILFAIATIIATGFTGSGVQAFNIADSTKNAFGISPIITGIIVSAIFGFAIFGGIKRVGKVAEYAVPFMATAYILLAFIILLINIKEVPAIFALIFSSAFNLNAAFGAVFGNAIMWGVKRGAYSNEAGQGTGAQAAGTAEVSHPAKQGFVQAFSVYVDTLFVCSATGFMLLMTDKYNVYNASNQFIVQNLPGVEVGPAFTQSAVDTLIPGFGSAFVAVALFFFAFTTLMAYYYISEVNLAYLAKRILNNNEKTKKVLINILKVVILASTYYGCVKTSTLAWTLGDIGVGVMAWINIIAILIIAKPALIALKDYEEQKKLGIPREKIDFNPIKLGIKNATFWEERLNNKK